MASPAPACSGTAAVGESCTPQRPGGAVCNPNALMLSGCFRGSEVYLETGSRSCGSGLCTAYRYDEVSDVGGRERANRVHCTCRCGVPPSLRGVVPASELCACPAGSVCVPGIAGPQYPVELQGSYCIRAAP